MKLPRRHQSVGLRWGCRSFDWLACYPGRFTYPNAYPIDGEYADFSPSSRHQPSENKRLGARALASGAKGRWFESTRAYQSKPFPFIPLRPSGVE